MGIVARIPIIFLLLGCLGLNCEAHADWRICNRTSSIVWTAKGWQGDGTTFSEGWYRIPGGRCQTMMVGSPEFTGVFYYAESENGDVWEGGPNNMAMCINPTNRFRFRDAASPGHHAGCVRRGFKAVTYTGDNHITTLSEPTPPGRTRIDPD